MKLVTWNTQWCCGTRRLVSPQRIVDGARALADFDVLCLQEIASGLSAACPATPGDQPAELQALLPGFQVFFGAAVDELDADGQRQRFGNLIATRLPVRAGAAPRAALAGRPGVRSMPRMCTVVTVRDPQLGPDARDDDAPGVLFRKPSAWRRPQALRALHVQACDQAAAPPLADDSRLAVPDQGAHAAGHPVRRFQPRRPHEPEYAAIQQPFGAATFTDAWPLLHGESPQRRTFMLYDRRMGPSRWPAISCSSAKRWRRGCGASRSIRRRRRRTISRC